jgi:hypothetical protein
MLRWGGHIGHGNIGCKTKSNSPSPTRMHRQTLRSRQTKYNADGTAPLPSEAAGYLIISCCVIDEGLAHSPACASDQAWLK